MKKAKSCGTIPIFKNENTIYFLVIKHILDHGGHWDFPKGHIEYGESEEQTALRETYEETHLSLKLLPDFREQIIYTDRINLVDKTVVFFLGVAASQDFQVQISEIETACWLTYEDALRILTFENSKYLLKKASEYIEKNYASIEYSK